MMIVDAVKTKLLSIGLVVAVTAALLCGYNSERLGKELSGKDQEIATLTTRLNIQTDTIKSLQEDLERKPKEYIKIVKEVDKELCEGIVAGDSILSLKTSKGKGDLVYEIQPKSGDVDLDGHLPAELIRLLQ